MTTRRTVWPALAVLVIGLFVFLQKTRPRLDKQAGLPANTDKVSRARSSDTSNPVSRAFNTFDAVSSGSGSRQALEELRKELTGMPADEAVGSIRSFLERGDDKSTELDFEIGNGGTLTGWPSFRTFLLDSLLVVDPAAAVEVSRQILDTPTTADEWAIALRNIGRVDSTPNSNSYLNEKVEALIKNPEWQAVPTIGYLNAFDILVHTQATESTPLLSDLLQRKDRRDLSHAAFLTLVRLVEWKPVDVLARLATDRELHQSRPEMVAQQFARADLRDSDQREIVRGWLLDPTRTATELRSFTGIYPNRNRLTSNNLLTGTAAPMDADLAARDREVLGILDDWARDPAFQPVMPHVQLMVNKLKGHVGQ